MPAAKADPEAMRAPLRVVIVQSAAKDARTLAGFFNRRRDHVWQTTQPAEALTLAQRQKPDLVMIDLHLPGTEWLDLLRQLRQAAPATRIIVTNKFPDLSREVLAKEQGVQIFLRQPFSREWVERALAQLSDTARPGESPLPAARAPRGAAPDLPRVRFPVAFKITVPYVVLAVLFVAGATYLINQYVVDTLQGRFTSQLVDAGTLSVDWMVQEETRLLDTLRALANTQGMAAALASGDAESIRSLALPVAVNERQESVEILDAAGTSLVSLRHQAGGPVEAYDFGRGDVVYRDWSFVQKVIQRQTDTAGDKYAGWVHAPWGDYFYIAGPVLDSQGKLAGVVLVGMSLPTLVRQIRAATLAQVSLYNADGHLLATTLPTSGLDLDLSGELASQLTAREAQDSLERDFVVASASYGEIVGPWRARDGAQLGLIGSALTRNYIAQPTSLTRLQAFALAASAVVVIVALGTVLSSRITRPLTQMVRASNQVAQGNLEVKVDTSGDDEVAVLAHAFNYMITGLQEGFIYRDLLGRTVSPEVREQLRQAFASGDLRLEGQSATASVLISDIRGFPRSRSTRRPPRCWAGLTITSAALSPLSAAMAVWSTNSRATPSWPFSAFCRRRSQPRTAPIRPAWRPSPCSRRLTA